MPETERSFDMGRLSDRLEVWFRGPGPKTVGSLIEIFGEKSFAVLFVLLLAVPALPLPTGGVTHVFELIAMLLALELIIGRRTVWLPERWQRREMGAAEQERFSRTLLKWIRWLERHSRPRLGFLLNHRLSGSVFGLLVLLLSLTAFLAPPFTGLDTVPSLGVVLLSLGVLLDDSLLALVGVVIGAAGLLLLLILGKAAYSGLESLF
ncbi:MAG TPA: exopolysaccharide biosynthesis protein [Solirubrobacterales bacterium]|nr:exopolysaccharide biosynthesis protein [Solirubrobacterales bacterium]